MSLQAREWCHRLGDEACVVDGSTDSGHRRWQCIRASTMVGYDGAEAPGRTQRWCGGFGQDSKMARAPGRSTTAQAPETFLEGNFGSLTA
jgi:hypothetical protein